MSSVHSDTSNVEIRDLEIRVATIQSKTSEDLKLAIIEGDFALCRALVEAGFSVDCRFICGCTPLLCALYYNRDEIARYVVDQGASFKEVF